MRGAGGGGTGEEAAHLPNLPRKRPESRCTAACTCKTTSSTQIFNYMRRAALKLVLCGGQVDNARVCLSPAHERLLKCSRLEEIIFNLIKVGTMTADIRAHNNPRCTLSTMLIAVSNLHAPSCLRILPQLQSRLSCLLRTSRNHRMKPTY